MDVQVDDPCGRARLWLRGGQCALRERLDRGESERCGDDCGPDGISLRVRKIISQATRNIDP